MFSLRSAYTSAQRWCIHRQLTCSAQSLFLSSKLLCVVVCYFSFPLFRPNACPMPDSHTHTHSRDPCDEIKRNFGLNIKMKIEANRRQTSPAYAYIYRWRERTHTQTAKKKTIIVMLIYLNVCLFCPRNFTTKCGCCWFAWWQKKCSRVVAHFRRTTMSAISKQTRQNVKLTCRLHQLQNNTILSKAVDAIHIIFSSLSFSLIHSPVSFFPRLFNGLSKR